MTRRKVELAGYSVEIPIELLPGASSEDEDERYERVRRELVDYEDAIEPPLWVTLTRRGPLPLHKQDLDEVLATCRDAVVDVLGVASDHPEVDWSYRQTEGSYALLVEVRPGADR
jgi:hypothetical protein